MREFRKRFWYEIALCASFFPLIHSTVAYAVEEDLVIMESAPLEDWEEAVLSAAPEIEVIAPEMIAIGKHSEPDVDDDMHTINFNNVSMGELIRFASKITGLNFVFEEGDVQFTVTLVSEEPVSAKSLMAALSQVMRMHDLLLLEQNGNVLITKSSRVNQIAPIISSDIPDSEAGNAAIVTRVFRIKNANVNSVANIIRPMTSDTALIEVSVETRQLIVTDITTNVEQIGSLLTSLDAPHTPLEIESYVVKNTPPDHLIALTQQILAPFLEGNPLIFVPQVDTNSIFVVSTPYLIERTIAVMEDLDIPPKSVVISKGGPKSVFFYKAQSQVPSVLVEELKMILKELKSEGSITPELELASKTVQVVEDSNSLMFVTDETTAKKLEEILTSIDSPASGKIQSTFLIYNPIYRPGAELEASMLDIQKNLKASGLANSAMIQAISSMKWAYATNSLIFTGDPESLQKIEGILKNLDALSGAAQSSQVFIYKPQYLSPEQIGDALKSLVQSLKSTHSPSDKSLVKVIESMKWNNLTQSFMATGDTTSIDRLKVLLTSIDTQQGAPGAPKGYFLYKLQSMEGDDIINELKDVASRLPASSLQNQNLIHAINNIGWIKSNNSLLLTGTSDAIAQLKTLIADFDQPLATQGSSFLVYKPKYLPPQEIQLALTAFTADLEAAGLNDPSLIQSLVSMRYVQATNSLLFTGSKETLDKVESLINSFDNANAIGAIQRIGNVTFLLYKIKESDPQQLITSLKTFSEDIKKTNIGEKELTESIDKVRWIKETNSLLFTGPVDVLQRIEQLLQKFDISSMRGSQTVQRTASMFVIYNPKNVSGEDLISILCDFMQNLVNSGVSDPSLFDTIDNLKWIEKTNSLLVSGEQPSVEKVQQLLQKFDVPGKEAAPSIESIENTSFLVYKLKYHPGNDIQESLKQVSVNLAKTVSASPTLVEAIRSLQWIQVTNSLLATGQQDVLVKLKELIQNLDVPLRQVFIDVLVVETSLTNLQNFGLQWGGQAQYMNKMAMGTGNFPLNGVNDTGGASPSGTFPSNLAGISAAATPKAGGGSPAIPFLTGFDLGVIGDIIMHKGKSFISLGSLVNAIQVDSDSTILLNPKIITQDNRQSTIFAGQNVPYTGSLVQNQTANTLTTSNIEYRDVGMSLTITPILGDNDVVTMEITQDISAVVDQTTSNIQSQQLTGLLTSHTHMDTRVSVPNNHFVALSGQISQSKVHGTQGIPCLGGLPVIGALFSTTSKTATKGNFIIFVKPTIINSYDDYKRVTEHQEWLFKDNASKQHLKEEFDEGISLVKTPDNE